MSRRSIREILAFMGESVTIEMSDGETPVSVAVVVKTVDSAGRAHLRTAGTSDGDLLRWPGARKVSSDEGEMTA